MFFLLLLALFLGSDDDDRVEAAGLADAARAARAVLSRDGAVERLPPRARASKGATTAPTSAKRTNGDVPLARVAVDAEDARRREADEDEAVDVVVPRRDMATRAGASSEAMSADGFIARRRKHGARRRGG